MRKTLLLLIILQFGAHYLRCQDVHFSQFFFSPQMLNPAEIGNFDAEYRLNANQKTQWKEVSRPYSSFAVMGDGHFGFTPEEVALGLLIMNDNAGDSRYNTLSILAGGSYRYNIRESEKHTLLGGLQLGMTQIKLDYESLSFNNQFNGVVYDPNLPTGEQFTRNSRWYFNLNAGLAYTYKPEDRKRITIGFSGHNITAPKQSFYNDTGIKLPIRTSLYATADWKIAEDFDLMPSMRWMDQATFTEVILGSALRYVLIDEGHLYRAVFAGYFGRFGDSGIAMLGFDYDAWRVAASYDINVSNLKPASRNRGGFEFSVQYLFNKSGSKNNAHKYCPVFL